MKNILRHTLPLLMLSACGWAHAGPPYLTDDPEPVELHHAEMNLAIQQTRSDAGRSGTAAADMNFGCAHETQCHVAVPAAYDVSDGAPMQRGIGDVELGVKYRFFNRADAGLMAAIYPTAFFPTGSASRGLGNGRAQLLLPVWVQKTSGPWTWDAGLSYTVNRAPGARSNWYTGLVAQRSLGERLKIGAEVFRRTPVALDAPTTAGFNVGAVVKLSENRNFLASAGRGFQGAGANRGSVYIAYQIEL